ncbi:hypothetical protein INT47_012460 [Mucor saturninus]|uniref:Uncharacterized protein n=1 Tax=Mucor saturninus TaxID=64648 RepID=A0A8H7QG80_9FUNG|nr:hypothetical protein INT47_012460 [Mucor saturninus]
MTNDDLALFNSRTFETVPEEARTGKNIIRLYPTNDLVDQCNGDIINSMNTEHYATSNSIHYNRTCSLLYDLQLQIDARYMITSNIDTSDELVNGATGYLKMVELGHLKPGAQSRSDTMPENLCEYGCKWKRNWHLNPTSPTKPNEPISLELERLKGRPVGSTVPTLGKIKQKLHSTVISQCPKLETFLQRHNLKSDLFNPVSLTNNSGTMIDYIIHNFDILSGGKPDPTPHQWKNVIWSDLSKFNVEGSDGRVRVTKKKKNTPEPCQEDCEIWQQFGDYLGVYLGWRTRTNCHHERLYNQ